MHIPDNYLSVSTCAALTVATAPVWLRSVKVVAREFPRERFSALGVGAAFAFLAMMFNVPLPGGTTGHAVGGVALAVLLGPEAACLSLTIALAVQALLFGDGGVLAFGANCFNMAFLLPFSGYYAFVLLSKALGISRGRRSLAEAKPTLREYIALGLASYFGLNVAALAAGVEFGLQPLLFHDASGQALFCPYPLSISVPAMALGHLTLFGLAEVVFSLAFYAFIATSAPDFAVNGSFFTQRESPAADALEADEDASISAPQKDRFNAVYLFLALLVALSPLGLLAEGTAWGEWGAEEIAETTDAGAALGYTPEAMNSGFQWSALLPDYTVAGLPEWLAYVLSAIAGVACVIIACKLSAFFLTKNATV